jgi:hypothetical protein
MQSSRGLTKERHCENSDGSFTTMKSYCRQQQLLIHDFNVWVTMDQNFVGSRLAYLQDP